jgi:DNA repair protein RecN (Recombination protein N)
MLRELRIRDFAIIDDLTIRFQPGLNVITGETGSGKSIIIGALSLLCGGRGGAEVVRGRAEAACIEALFDHPASVEGLGIGADDELLIRRVIPQSGKGRVYVNGSPATVTLLARLGAHLVHVYGQHEQALLLDPRSHLELLDQFGDLMPLRQRIAEAFAQLSRARTELRDLVDRRQSQEQRRDLLQFQVQELSSAGTEADEEERLRRERDILRHAERLQQVCHAAEAALYADEASMVSGLARLLSQLRDLVRIDAALAEPAQMIESASVQLEEAALNLRRYADRVQYDPERLAAIEERLALLVRLAKKYRAAPADLPAILAVLQQELASLDMAGAECAAAQVRVDALTEQALSVAAELSHARRGVANRLEAAMTAELGVLGMKGATFSVTRAGPEAGGESDDLDVTGFDRIEFFLSANPGEPARPLAQVASGGELSRIMLALKTLTATVTETPIIIFDEVDAGIGGAVADSVARRLAALAKTHQLLCITHLPQIAAHADHHLAVHKEARRERTVAQAHILTAEERVTELTRMLGGAVAPSEAKRYAQRLLAQAREAARH